MIRLEIIHNKRILTSLKDLRKQGYLAGFTAVHVYAGYGPEHEEFKDDHVGDSQYQTLVLMESKEKAQKLVNELRKIDPITKFKAFITEIEEL